MAATIDIFTGSALSDRAHEIDAFFVENLPAARLLVPTREHARQRMAEMLRRGLVTGFLKSPVLTFQDFVADLLHRTPYQQELIDEGAQRILLEHIVADMAAEGRLDAIGPAATTPGFIAHLHRTIAQLKQSAVEPGRFMRTTKSADRDQRVDRVVGYAYTTYQQALKSAGAYDVQGMYWMADLACEKALPASVAGVRVLVLDGFDDFTESEFRLVKTLARHIESVVFALVVDMDRSAEDQGRLVRDTFSLIEKSFDFANLQQAESREPESQIQFASLHLFGRTEEFPDPSLTDNIRLIECYNPRHEAEIISAEIKRAVRDGKARLNRIAVVHADAQTAASRFHSTFHHYGIPCNVRGGTPLDACGLGAFVRSLFHAIESWSRSDILQIAASPFVGTHPANAFEAIARAAGITQGREQWRERIHRFASASKRSEPSYESALNHIPNLEEECERLIATVARIEAAADAFPDPCTAGALAEWVSRALDTVGVTATLDHLDPDTREACNVERAEIEQALSRLHRWYGDGPIDPEQAPRMVRQCLSESQLPFERDRGGVWFGRPEDIRHLKFDIVFCAGMSEGVFPSKPSGNAIYGDEDRAELAGLGIRLRDAEWYEHRQTGLFQRIFDCAEQELVLTWPLTGSAGESMSRSPYVEDLEVLFESLPIEKMGTPSHAVLPQPERCGSPREARNLILDAQVAVQNPALPGLEAAQIGAEVESRRYASGPFDEFDGIISQPAQLASLNQKFDADHRFSASELGVYLSCPFRFFLERVLRVKTIEEPDDAFNPMLRGLILHHALESFYAKRAGAPLDMPISAQAEQELDHAIDAAFHQWAWATAQLPPAVVDIEKTRLRRRLLRFIHWSAEEEDNAGWAPTHFEVQFGRPNPTSPDSLSTPEPFRLDTGAGPVLVQGTIDRIDRSGSQVRIIDYKSGAVPQLAKLKDGTEIQLALYAMAVSSLLIPDAALQSALYWSPGRTAKSDGKRDAFKGREWSAEDAFATVPESVAMAVTGVRSGKFGLKAADKRCVGCPEGKVCRFEEGRVDRKVP